MSSAECKARYLISMMQAEVPPDKQGRVFAVLMQIAPLVTRCG